MIDPAIRAVLYARLRAAPSPATVPGALPVVVALPDFPTYRALHRDTVKSLGNCGIGLWWVAEGGAVTD